MRELGRVDRFTGAQTLEQHLGPAQHRSEPIVDVVGDPGGQRSQRPELLLANDAKAQLVLGTDVAKDPDALKPSVPPLDRRQREMHRPGLAGARDQEQLSLVGRLLPHLRDQRSRVLSRRQEVRPVLAGKCLAHRAHHGQERPVREEHAVVGIDHHDAFPDPAHDVGQLARLHLQPRMLDGNGDAVGDDAEQPVGAAVDPPRAPRDLEHADGDAADDQGRRHHRAERARLQRPVLHARIGGGAVAHDDR